MLETIISVVSFILGVLIVFAVQKLYEWIVDLSKRVERLKWELGHYTTEQKLWNEFHEWKRTQKGKQ